MRRLVFCLGLMTFSLSMGSLGCGETKPASDPSNPPANDGTEGTKWEGPQAQDPAKKTSSAKLPDNAPARKDSEYDKEQTDIVLARAARQVKANCGEAKDDDGKASGPWGKTKVSVVLGRNGHSKGVTVPPPFDGKATGKCVIQAFSNLTFPPWAGQDTTVEWDVELTQAAAPAKPEKK